MCHKCETNPVYEFTNKRKVCKNCFVRYFDKKLLYTIRKFNLANRKDIILYKEGNSFKDVVLEECLRIFSQKSGAEIIKSNNINLNSRKATKIAIINNTDSEAYLISREIIKGDLSKNKDKFFPLDKNKKIIKPLYLFTDKEIMLYAKIKKLKFKEYKEKKDNLSKFIDVLELKHPEIKRAIVNSYLKLYG